MSHISNWLCRRFQPERLPLSECAAHLHVRLVHLHAVIWGTLDKVVLKATDWGWESVESCLKPVKIVGDIAPQSVLKFVRCYCNGNCSSKCVHVCETIGTVFLCAEIVMERIAQMAV